MTKQENLYLEQLENVPHALLLKTQYCCDLDTFLKTYFKKTLLSSQPLDNLALYLQKIDDDNYTDLIVLDANVENIKKEQIIELQNQFLKPAIEKAGFKFCVIKNFHKVSESVFNTLLKTLEEPTKNTYFVLTTDSFDNVNQTILSRCQRFSLNTDEELLDQLLKEHPNKKNWSKSFNDLLDFKQFLLSENLNEYEDFLQTFINHQLDDYKKVNEIFKKYDYKQIYLVISLLSTLGTNNFKALCYKLLSQLNLNPSKTLLFYQLWETWGK